MADPDLEAGKEYRPTRQKIRDRFRHLRHIGWLIAAVLLVVFGLMTIWLPLPTGGLSLVGGVVLLLRESRHFRQWFTRWRAHSRRVDAFFDRITPVLPSPLREVIARTDPDPPTGSTPDPEDRHSA